MAERERLSHQEQIRALKLAREKGYNTSNMTDAQYKTLSILSRISEPTTLITDGFTATTSFVKTRFMGGRVPLPIFHKRKARCETNKCSYFLTLQDGAPACNLCNCSNKMLRSKWADPAQSCPATPAAKDAIEYYWANYTQEDATRDGFLTIEGKRIDPSIFKYNPNKA